MRSGDGLEVLMSVWSQNSVFCGRCVKREIESGAETEKQCLYGGRKCPTKKSHVEYIT